MSETADVVVVGGGLEGCAAAWALAPGEHVVVAEAGGRRSEPVAFEVR